MQEGSLAVRANRDHAAGDPRRDRLAVVTEGLQQGGGTVIDPPARRIRIDAALFQGGQLLAPDGLRIRLDAHRLNRRRALEARKGRSKWPRCKARDERIPRRTERYAAGRHEERNEADRPFSTPD